jgi:hypothetical protein
MRTNYSVKDVEVIESEAYSVGVTVGQVAMRDRVVELLRSEQELASGFSARNALINDLIELIREEL